jgi:hypothetical protein
MLAHAPAVCTGASVRVVAGMGPAEAQAAHQHQRVRPAVALARHAPAASLAIGASVTAATASAAVAAAASTVTSGRLLLTSLRLSQHSEHCVVRPRVVPRRACVRQWAREPAGSTHQHGPQPTRGADPGAGIWLLLALGWHFE